MGKLKVDWIDLPVDDNTQHALKEAFFAEFFDRRLLQLGSEFEEKRRKLQLFCRAN